MKNTDDPKVIVALDFADAESVLALAQAHPELAHTVIAHEPPLNQLVPDREDLLRRTDEMIAMAWKHPNVYIGLDAYAPKHWPASIVHFINTFGQDKVLFGSDWPVCLIAADYERVWDLINNYLAYFGQEDQEKIMGLNAVDFYNLNVSHNSNATLSNS